MRDLAWTNWLFFHRGDDFFDHLVRRVREARKSIQIETYIFDIDPLTEELLKELGAARRRGCRVQLLVDGVGSYIWLDTLKARCAELGLELRVWVPVPRTFASFRRMLWLGGFRLLRIFRYFNRRNHRKIVLIDHRYGILGSQNWTQVHSEKLMGEAAWRDSGLEIQGPEIATLARSMGLAWRRSSPKRLKVPFRGLKDRRYQVGLSPLRLNQDRRSRRFLMNDLLDRIRNAQNRILIESAYFLPSRRQFMALKRAAARGVVVGVILPDISDVPLVKWAAHDLIRALVKAGVHIFEYQNRILHAKYTIVDDWATIGSSNFNHRSLFHDLEVEASFTQSEPVNALVKQWETDCERSKVIDPRQTHQDVFWKRWFFHLAFRLRYVL
ncbi:MAG TPA: phosphatidylserine/phosphatidylglycerophosphate/cardiolipin synthase family protein [Pseudobdellovibrionaceae bacterium]|nr:phosphatidylserine/phosphatidylglycerophosphate/cardiolipin synthase family protein [Pseudobdellovibrionaceae bacterium]